MDFRCVTDPSNAHLNQKKHQKAKPRTSGHNGTFAQNLTPEKGIQTPMQSYIRANNKFFKDISPLISAGN
jgi:hypothetical protein